MTIDQIESAIAAERAALLSHQEKFSADELKEECAYGLSQLDIAESETKRPAPNMDILMMALSLGTAKREEIDEKVRQRGHNLIQFN